MSFFSRKNKTCFEFENNFHRENLVVKSFLHYDMLIGSDFYWSLVTGKV